MYKGLTRLSFLLILAFVMNNSVMAQFKVSGNFTSGSLFSFGEPYGVYQTTGLAFAGISKNDTYLILSGAFFPNINFVTAVGDEQGIPLTYSLEQNFPNPFNPSTKIKYALPKSSSVRITVYDVLGREVRTLINEEQNAGYHEMNFSAADLASGIYFYNIRAAEFVQTKKMILLK